MGIWWFDACCIMLDAWGEGERNYPHAGSDDKPVNWCHKCKIWARSCIAEVQKVSDETKINRNRSDVAMINNINLITVKLQMCPVCKKRHKVREFLACSYKCLCCRLGNVQGCFKNPSSTAEEIKLNSRKQLWVLERNPVTAGKPLPAMFSISRFLCRQETRPLEINKPPGRLKH